MKNKKNILFESFGTGLKVSFLGLLMVLGFNSVVATDLNQQYEEDFWNFYREGIDKFSLSAYGESLGCEAHPSKTEELTVSSAQRISFSDIFNENQGLADIGMIVEGKYYYMTEKDVNYEYYFSLMAGNKPATYVMNYYSCESSTPSETPDGYKHNDLICDHGTSISRLVCKSKNDCSSYSYEEVMGCKSGTYCSEDDTSTCVMEKSDNVRSTYGGGDSGDWSVDTKTSKDTQRIYENVQTQLENKVYDNEKVNEAIREQQNEWTEVENKVSAAEDKNRNDSAADTPIGPFVFIAVVGSILVGFGIWRFTKK